MPGFKSLVGAVCAATLVTSSAFAGASAPLAPGKPAGVHGAQLSSGTLLLGAVGVAIIATAAIVVTDQNNDRSQPLQGNTPIITSTTST